jgi:hypothetical protein
MKNEEFSYVEIIWVIFIFLLAIYVFNYYKNNPDQTYQNVPTQQLTNSQKPNGCASNASNASNASGSGGIANNSNHKNNLAPPPKLTNLYNEKSQVIHSKNDIDIINKNNILMYKDEFQTSNPTFESELINTNMSGEFSHDLEKVYTQDLVENTDTNHDYNEMFDYCVKPNKSDLPIANVPLYALKDTTCSLKLSDNFNKL